jgi:hypothetical protein
MEAVTTKIPDVETTKSITTEENTSKEPITTTKVGWEIRKTSSVDF